VILLVACAWLGNAHAQDARLTLYVFLQLDVKPNILQQMLQKQLPELTVTVFGRFRDFQDVVATKQPDAILAIPPLLDLDHTKATLQGSRGGREWEEYVLVFSGSNQPASLSGKTVGVVDLLGHDGTQAFAVSLLKTSDFKVKRVAKVEDLLALLEFSAADAILIPGSVVKRLTERTRLPLAVRELPGAHVGLPAVAVLHPANRDTILRSVRGLDAETKSLLGIDSWSAR
jgi:ABC-type amino acid transport substrate-binding protein